ncbi:MAG: hypothetical protein K2X41_09960 [Hyphomicrobium sp.]|nr:hypothetical protein [Hyphomicrobium sp.]
MMTPSTVNVFSVGSRPQTPAYAVATLVTDRQHHADMRASLIAGGFSQTDCEYLAVDNTGNNQADAYRGLNALLNAAEAPIVILCHQDIRLIADGRSHLDRALAALTTFDPTWAVAGNAGGIGPGRLAIRISDPHGRNRHIGKLPARVQSLDENLLIVRRDARIGFSGDLTGFHFYGADICLHASQMGYAAYVIDFHIEHISPGRKGADFVAAEAAFRAKWSKALSPRWLQTTCSLVRLSSGPVNRAMQGRLDRVFSGVIRKLPRSSGWKRLKAERA